MEIVGDFVAQAKQVKEAYVFDLLGKRNVVGVGLGYKISHGVNTGELGLIVSVTHKADVSALAAKDVVPQALNGIKTDVVVTGKFYAQDSNTDPKGRWRPVVPPGVSIGHPGVTAGTFGCLVRRGNEVFILSNNHVLADVNAGKAGDPILQPGVADGGTADDHIAKLADYVPIDFGTSEPECSIVDLITKTLNYVAGAFGSSHQLQAVKKTPGVNRVDAALARPLSPDLVKNEILNIGVPAGVGAVTLGLDVQKMGRTTGHTTGKVTQIDATVQIDYDGLTGLYSGQIIASPMSQGGDSGSAVLDMDKRVVGLLFAGSDAATIINPIDEVFSALNVELAL
ncbi:MAG: hypothetical protein ACK2US_15475 [Anaerolineae bacterium]|jgi:hypothetical protein